MAKYIDVDNYCKNICRCAKEHYDKNKCPILTAPAADVVSVGVLGQVQWERDVAIEQLKSYGVGFAEKADVVRVKHGKWYRHDKKIHGDTCYHCSVCERMALTDCGMVWELTPYCPFCGAKMDGGKENEQT